MIEDDNIQILDLFLKIYCFIIWKCYAIILSNIYPETCCINILEAMAFYQCNLPLGAIPETSNGLSSLHDPVIDVNTMIIHQKKL